MIINLDNLGAGIRWWNKNNWEKDILNADYDTIYNARSEGATENWWIATVDRLSKWGVIRPKPKAEITRRGEDCLGRNCRPIRRACGKINREINHKIYYGTKHRRSVLGRCGPSF